LIDDPSTPPAMKAWLEKAVPNRMDMAGEEDYFLHTHIGLDPKAYDTGILKWAWMPDWHALNDPKDAKVEPFGQHERLMHFIDLEYFLTGSTTRAYKPDLSSKPKLDAFPNDRNDPRYIQAGYLPLRVPQMYGELVKAIRENRLHPTGPEDQNSAEYFAGYLSHYLADNTQPQHATIDYKSASYFKIQRKAPNAHAAVEYQMCDDDEKNAWPELRKEFWPKFTQQLQQFEDPIVTDDLFKATLEVSLASYDALPLIGEAAAKAARTGGINDKTDVIDCEQFFHYAGTIDGRPMTVMEMKPRQTAWAVKRIQRVWKQAWMEANQK
jgi:hypothetical protein